MTVHYYEVKNCLLGQAVGKPALFPPDDADEKQLDKNGFVKWNESGKWCRFLTNEEYQYIMRFEMFGTATLNDHTKMNDSDITNDSENDDGTAKWLSLASVALMIFSLIGIFETKSGDLVYMFLWIVALVLIIIVRVRYPNNALGKTTMKIYTVLTVAGFVFTILAIIACVVVGSMLINTFCDCVEGCGRIG